MTSNKSIISKFLILKLLMPKKLSAIYVAKNFWEEGMMRQFCFDFNMRGSLFDKKRVQFVNGFHSFKYGIHIFQL